MPTTILKPYYFMFRNRFRFKTALRNTMRRDLLVLLVTLIIMLCIFLGFVMILHTLEDYPLVREIIPRKIIELMFYAFFFLLLVSNTIAATGNIYTAQNMDLFLSTPTSNIQLYVAKLCEMLVETSLMFVIFIVPVGCAYEYTLDLYPGLVMGSLTVVIPFLLIPAGISVPLATGFVKFASVVWRRGYFLFLCIVAIGTYALLSLLSLLQQVQLQRGGVNAIVQIIGFFDNPNPTWLPSRWVVDLLTYYVTGSVDNAGLKLLLLWTCALGSLALGYLTFDLFVVSVRSVADMHKRPAANGNPRTEEHDIFRAIFENLYLRLPINVQFRAIMLKDLTSMVRDRAQSLSLVLYLGIALVALVLLQFMSSALDLAVIAQQSWWAFLASCNILFTGFVITALMTRLVYPSISLEGKSFWILIVAPIDLQKLISAKYWCWLPLVALIATALLAAGVLAIHATPALILGSVFVGICLSIGCTGLAIGIGAIFASFEWESPTQIATGFGTLVLLLSSLALVLLTFAPASALMFLCAVPQTRAIVGEHLAPFAAVGLGLLILLVNMAVSYYSCKKGIESLAARNI
jgi:ABC-2 type transport system permease protein